MTVETYAPPPVYTVVGTGPYAVQHAYTEGALIVVVETADALVTLDAADWSVSPASSTNGGTVFLTAAAAALHANRPLVILRDTGLEQGWQAHGGAREAGLEAQLDRLTQGIQDARRDNARSVKVSTGAPPDLRRGDPGQFLRWGPDGGLESADVPNAGDGGLAGLVQITFEPFACDGVTTAFTLPRAALGKQFVRVVWERLELPIDAYSLSADGRTVTLTEAPPAQSTLHIRAEYPAAAVPTLLADLLDVAYPSGPAAGDLLQFDGTHFVPLPPPFGLGAEVPPLLANLNAVATKSGFYRTDNSTTGTFPPFETGTTGQFGTLLVMPYNAGAGSITQVFVPTGNVAGADRLYHRTYNTASAGWGDWISYATEDEVLAALTDAIDGVETVNRATYNFAPDLIFETPGAVPASWSWTTQLGVGVQMDSMIDVSVQLAGTLTLNDSTGRLRLDLSDMGGTMSAVGGERSVLHHRLFEDLRLPPGAHSLRWLLAPGEQYAELAFDLPKEVRRMTAYSITGEPAAGEIITGTTSGATAVIRDIVLPSSPGDPLDRDGPNAGQRFLYVTDIVGTWTANEDATGNNVFAGKIGGTIASPYPQGVNFVDSVHLYDGDSHSIHVGFGGLYL